VLVASIGSKRMPTYRQGLLSCLRQPPASVQATEDGGVWRAADGSGGVLPDGEQGN
jgi:hypothetical protein